MTPKSTTELSLPAHENIQNRAPEHSNLALCNITDSLLEATREASRSAHRWRDAAANQYECRHFGLASYAKRQKEQMYRLKERGIVSAHRNGLLHYAGASPQGMAVYEYGDGGMCCLHSSLHPIGAERTLVPAHPEVLLVPAKKARLRMADVVLHLSSLPEPNGEYQRSAPPKFVRSVTCWTCGDEGHTSRYCPMLENADEDENENEW